MLRKKELQFFYQYGTHFIYPDAWDDYLKPIPESERGDLIKVLFSYLYIYNIIIGFEEKY
jgi:proline iminopeptidase